MLAKMIVTPKYLKNNKSRYRKRDVLHRSNFKSLYILFHVIVLINMVLSQILKQNS